MKSCHAFARLILVLLLLAGCGKTSSPVAPLVDKGPPTSHPVLDFAPLKGITLTEIGEHGYDAAPTGLGKTEAQIMADVLYGLGVRHVVLSPRALMRDPRGTDLSPLTYHRDRYLRLIAYLHGKGMTVGIRPLLFVVDAKGKSPLVESFPDGSSKIWWHGNIEPRDPQGWFASFQAYLEPFFEIAGAAAVEEFTIGAELQSMTVGLTGRSFGYADHFLGLLHEARARLPSSTRILYDVNYTDVAHHAGRFDMAGGELAVWVSSLLGFENHPLRKELTQFWTELDAVGIDMYRSLATDRDVIPENYGDLVSLLHDNAAVILADLNGRLDEVALAVGVDKKVAFKEVGYRSVTNSFVRPFEYAGGGTLNVSHQAAAYEGLLGALSEVRVSRFRGVVLWDASVNLALHGPLDLGFSPVGKEETERVLRNFFLGGGTTGRVID